MVDHGGDPGLRCDQVVQGFAPQLTLTAAILAQGGFPAPPTEALVDTITDRVMARFLPELEWRIADALQAWLLVVVMLPQVLFTSIPSIIRRRGRSRRWRSPQRCREACRGRL